LNGPSRESKKGKLREEVRKNKDVRVRKASVTRAPNGGKKN
jgi:hypothetical protein